MRFAAVLSFAIGLCVNGAAAGIERPPEWTGAPTHPAPYTSLHDASTVLPVAEKHGPAVMIAASPNQNRDTVMVHDAQRMLSELGFPVGAIDGIYGRKTYHAIVDFQKSQNVPLTGNVSVPLLLLLTEALKRADSVPSAPSSAKQETPDDLGIFPATPRPDGSWSLGHKTAAIEVLDAMESTAQALRFGLLTHRHRVRVGLFECTYEEVDIWAAGPVANLSPDNRNFAARLVEVAQALSAVCPRLSVLWVAVRSGNSIDGPDLGGKPGGLYIGRLEKSPGWTDSMTVYRAASIPMDWRVGPHLAATCYRKIRSLDAAEFGLAVEQCEIAAEHDADNADLLYQLGRLENLRKRYGRAFQWFTKAAARDESKAYPMLGHFHEVGKGVSRNPAEAAAWYARASEHAVPWAARHLGQMYFQGRGVPRDFLQAKSWYERAQADGDLQAAQDLELLARVMEKEPADTPGLWQCDCLDVVQCGVSPFSVVVEDQVALPPHYGACRPWH